MTGNAGSDVFVYAAGGGADTIIDFSRTVGDKIDLTAMLSVSSLADVLSRATQTGAGTLIDFGRGDTLLLADVTRASLVASDILFSDAIEAVGGTRLLRPEAITHCMRQAGQRRRWLALAVARS